MKRLPKGHKAQIMGTRMFQTMYTADQMREFAQPSKPWVGLSEQERNNIEDYCEMIIGKAAFDAIEAKLKEKNT